MNVITIIYKPADFEFIISTEILITHDYSRQEDEIYFCVGAIITQCTILTASDLMRERCEVLYVQIYAMY